MEKFCSSPGANEKKKSKIPYVVTGRVVAAAALVLVMFLTSTLVPLHDVRGSIMEIGENNVSDSVLTDGEELGLYPAYIQLPSGYAVCPDCETNPPGRELIWSTSNPEVATVDADGLITAVSTGEAFITATLKDKPEVSAGCGVYVVEFLENENALNDIIIWEDGPPSLSYQATMYGKAVTPSDEQLSYEKPGENIPIALSTDDEDLSWNGPAINNLVYTKQYGFAQFLSAGGRKPNRPTRINKKNIRKKLKDNTVWTIVVSGKHSVFLDYLDRTIIETFNLLAKKTGGDSPVGLYGGSAEYTRFYDNNTHYAKYPDHSQCPDCSQRWYDELFDEEVIGFVPPPVSGHGTSIEWKVFDYSFFKGYYINAEAPGSLFYISQTDMVRAFRISSNGLSIRKSEVAMLSFAPGNEYFVPVNGPVFQFVSDDLAPLAPVPGKEDELAPLVPVPDEIDDLAPLARLKWFEIEAYVYDNYVCYENAPTNLGNNWGRTYNDETNTTLKIIIYTDSTVNVNSRYHGSLIRAVK